MANDWVNNGDVNFAEYGGNLTRLSEHDPQVVEVFRLETPSATGDGYRAFSFQIDLDDFDRSNLLPVLQTHGYVTSDGSFVYPDIDKEPTVMVRLTDSSWDQMISSIGPHRLTDMIVSYYGSSWCDWETYHDRDEGYAGPYSDTTGGLKPWGALTAAEADLWMSQLGCGVFAPYTSVIERVPEGVVFDDGSARQPRAPFFAVTALLMISSDGGVCQVGPKRLGAEQEGAWLDWSPTFDAQDEAIAWAQAYRDRADVKDYLSVRSDIDDVTLLVVSCDVERAIESLRDASWAWADAGDICEALAPEELVRIPIVQGHAERAQER